MAEPSARAGDTRPLSPHLQIYRWEITMLMSITHRVTGIGLAIGTPLLVWWFVALALGPDSFATAQRFFGSWFGQLLLFGWSVALFYHLVNGVRHLVWDLGIGLEPKAYYASGYAALAATAVLTVVAWIAGYAAR